MDLLEWCLKKESSIVTFNYDDVLDQALWEVHQAVSGRVGTPYWHPDGGYGFFCRPSITCVSDHSMYMDQTRTLLMKLHGSINWYSRLGEGALRGPAGLLHHESWLPHARDIPHYEARDIEAHLESDPFIVPPVLVKSELATHPVLRVVWELAHRVLIEAKTVVFIGYSLPATDLASRILFRETVWNKDVRDVSVVNFASGSSDAEEIKAAYRSLFHGLPDAQFDFAGAANWVERQISMPSETTTLVAE